MRRFFTASAIFCVVAIFAARDGCAQKVPTVSDLYGRWCGETTIYVFSPGQLTVTFLSGSPQRVWRIKSVTTQGKELYVYWDPRDSNQNGSSDPPMTSFGDFNGSTMVQMPNTAGDMGPRREFHRC
jgi:hypothetical protein